MTTSAHPRRSDALVGRRRWHASDALVRRIRQRPRDALVGRACQRSDGLPGVRRTIAMAGSSELVPTSAVAIGAVPR